MTGGPGPAAINLHLCARRLAVSLIDDVLAEVYSKGPACQVDAAYRALSAEDAEDLSAVLRNDSVYGATIARVLSRRLDRKVSAKSVQRHRRGDCGCER